MAFFSALLFCTPSYLNNEGEALHMLNDPLEMLKKAKASIWAGDIVKYTRLMENWRADGKLEGIEVRSAL